MVPAVLCAICRNYIGAILQRGESLISGKSRAPKDRCPIVGREVSYEALIFKFRIQLDIGGWRTYEVLAPEPCGPTVVRHFLHLQTC